MTTIKNVFTPAVLENIKHLSETTRSGIGYVLPEPELIGRILKDFVDREIEKKADQGVTWVNPLGDANSIFDVYV